MKNKLKLSVTTLALVPLLFSVEAQETIYKCVNAKAEVYYNDQPCHVTTIERKLKAVKDPEGGYIPPRFVSEEAKSGSTGVVVGGVSSRKLDNSKKDKSDNSDQAGAGAASNGSNTGTQASSSASTNNSSGSSNYSSNSQSSNNSTNQGDSASKRQTKRVIHKERDYERVVERYDD